MTRDVRRLLAVYYGPGTLLFWGMDIILSAPMRASFIGRPMWRVVYYLGLLGLGALCRWRPASAPLVGMIESAVNFFLVLLSILFPVWGLTDQVLAGDPASEVGLPFTTWTIMNALLSGAVFAFAFQRSTDALTSRRPGGTGEKR